jgi:hypothetical protein
MTPSNKISIIKFSLLLFLFTISISLKSQSTCGNFKIVIDHSHFTTSGSDTAFVQYIQFDTGDTTLISKISYTLFNITDGIQVQQDYNFSNISYLQDLTVAKNCYRNKKNITISLGYLGFLEKNFKITIGLYDVANNLLSNSNFNFNR